ncbi:hypothetical protein [Streptomyces sp. NPDC059761]|uniref:hypothetical protein n=1 Tax=Streptomyces sp. NPDC059761 TaxID=3346937 RepID=UPI003662D36C
MRPGYRQFIEFEVLIGAGTHAALPVTDFLRVTATEDNRDAARKLSRSAVDSSLAASGQVTKPMETTYRHLGEVFVFACTAVHGGARGLYWCAARYARPAEAGLGQVLLTRREES